MSSKSLKTGAFAQSIYKQSAIQMEELDTVRILADGRMFAYAKAGAADLVAGNVLTSVAPDSNASNEALSATQSAAIGATQVTVTFGGAVIADAYKDGYIWANDATGEGHLYRVKGHAAGTTDVVVYLKDPIRVAWVASTTEFSAIVNRQNGVIIAAATIAAHLAGVTPIVVTALYYFWNQVKGPAAVLTKGTLVVGNPCTVITTAGSVGPLADATLTPVVGVVMSNLGAGGDTEYALINLDIPGY